MTAADAGEKPWPPPGRGEEWVQRAYDALADLPPCYPLPHTTGGVLIRVRDLKSDLDRGVVSGAHVYAALSVRSMLRPTAERDAR